MSSWRPRHERMTDGADALRSGLGEVGDGFGTIVSRFHETVGPELARVATPTSLRRGTLTVRCSSASWAQTINMMEQELVERLRGALGRGTVTRVVARSGGPQPVAEASPAPRLAPLDEPTLERLTGMVAAIGDQELRSRVLAAAIAAEQRRRIARNP